MKSRVLASCFLCFFGLLVSCGNHEAPQQYRQPHIGVWTGTDPSGTQATVVFEEGGRGSITFDETLHPFDYLIDYTKDPTWLDLIYTQDGKPFRAKVILRFQDRNTIEWRTFFNAKRPEGFGEEDDEHTILLKRVNPAQEA